MSKTRVFVYLTISFLFFSCGEEPPSEEPKAGYGVGYSVAVDSQGNVYMTGRGDGTPDDEHDTGWGTIFLAKWKSDGVWEWTRQWGASFNDTAYAVTVDDTGNIYVAGTTEGALDGNSNANKDNSTISTDIFLTKWTTTGVKQWTKQWGSSDWDTCHAIAVDDDGHIYVTGDTYGQMDGIFNMGHGDVFVSKWNADGSKGWTQLWGTGGYESGYSVAVDNEGNIYMTGNTAEARGGNEVVGISKTLLVKWTADGTKEWEKQWGPENGWSSGGAALVVDEEENMYVAGSTCSNEADPDTNSNTCKMLVTRWNADGSIGWQQQMGDLYMGEGNSLSLGKDGFLYLTGGSYTLNAASRDMFVAQWSVEDGSEEWTDHWGSDENDDAYGVAVNGQGDIYVVGQTSGSLNDQECQGGGCGAFLAKWTVAGIQEWIQQWDGDHWGTAPQ